MKEVINLFWTFAKIGTVTFGSGYVMITIVETEFVAKRKWFSQDEFVNYLSLATSFPGPIVINLASLVGHQKFGTRGLIAGFMGASLPSFVILLLIAMFFSRISDTPEVIAIFKGLRPAVVALILIPVINFGKLITKPEYLVSAAVAVLLFLNWVSPILIISAAVCFGLYRAFRIQQKLPKQ